MRCLLLLLLLLPSIAVAQTLPTTRGFEVGRIDDPEIKENSGIVQSRRFPGVFWTLNDSGNPPKLYAIDRVGKTQAAFTVDAPNRDWEDLAVDDAGHLYIGEIGNNNGRLNELLVYQVDEPDPKSPADKPLAVKQTWRLHFPDKPFDCEGLFVWQNHGYVVSKYRDRTPAALYRFSLDPQKEPAVLEKVCELPIKMPATAADISAKGDQVMILTVAGPYLFDLPKKGDVASIKDAAPSHVFFMNVDMEAACFVEDGILATTEKRNVYLFRWSDFGQ